MTQRPKKFIVYHIRSTMADTTNAAPNTYAFEHHAKARVAKLNARRPGEFAYATIDHYNSNVVYMVERTNLMSGQKYMEPSNTPGYMSPASEAYWSM